jgi:hypothetical protein
MGILESKDVDGRGYWLARESIRLYPRHLAAPWRSSSRLTVAGVDADRRGAISSLIVEVR